jgi:DNA-directed RNA polymerase subunit RPC12/RpoP
MNGCRVRARPVVLNNPSEQVRECLQHAEECAREAAELPNGSPSRQDFLRLEQRWLELAEGIEFGKQLDSFTNDSAKPKPLRQVTMRPFSYRCPDCGWDIETLMPEVASNEQDTYQPTVCPNCQQLHSVNPANGKILVEDGLGDPW